MTPDVGVRVKRAERLDEREGVLRVTHLISGDLWAGAETATFHLIRALAQRSDTRVSAVVLNEGELARRLKGSGIETTIVPESGRSFRELRKEVAAALSKSQVVHAHRYKESLLASLCGVPWVATQHGRPEPFSGIAGLRMALYLALDILLKRFSARRVLAVSAAVEESLRPPVGRATQVRGYDGRPEGEGLEHTDRIALVMAGDE